MPNGNQWSPTAGTRGKELTGRFDWAAGKTAGERWMSGVSFLSSLLSFPFLDHIDVLESDGYWLWLSFGRDFSCISITGMTGPTGNTPVVDESARVLRWHWHGQASQRLPTWQREHDDRTAYTNARWFARKTDTAVIIPYRLTELPGLPARRE